MSQGLCGCYELCGANRQEEMVGGEKQKHVVSFGYGGGSLFGSEDTEDP